MIAAQQPTAGTSERRAIDAQLKDIVKVYPSQEVPAVDGISLDIAHGEFFSLLGPSGCGKTTTLRMLAGLERPTAGRILIRGQDMTATPAHRRPTNMVFQRLALFPHMSVAGNIAFGPQLQHLPRQQVRKRVDALLEMVHLTGYGTRLPDQLSGGQQQRVACARALAGRPDIIFGDEPTGNLDSRSSGEVLGILRQSVSALGQTVVIVTHDPRAAGYADRVVFLADGQIVDELREPTADKVLDRMKNLEQV